MIGEEGGKGKGRRRTGKTGIDQGWVNEVTRR
jgi:hypothetical protein